MLNWTLITKRKWSLLVLLTFMLLKFLMICFYRTFSRPWCLLKKNVTVNPAIKASLLRLILFLHFSIYNVIMINIQWSKQPPYTWSCFLKLHFVVCFCYFWKFKSLFLSNFFISEYLDKILPWKEKKLGFFVKPQTKYFWLCLR